MAISDNYSPDISYGNGVTTVFTGTWKVLNEDYFNCKLRNVSTGAEELLSNGSDYTLTFDDSGYQVTLTSAPSNEYQVIRYRSVSMDQSSPYKTSKGFQGAVIENSFDKITAIAQDMQDTVSRSLVRDIASNECDISGAVLHNVGAAIYNNDAVTKGYVDELAIIAGNVPSPAIGDVGSVLEATGEGLFDWVAPTVPEIALTDIADIAAGTMLVRLPGSGNGPPVAATMTAAGYSLMDDADAAAQRTTLGLGSVATQNANAAAITVNNGASYGLYNNSVVAIDVSALPSKSGIISIATNIPGSFSGIVAFRCPSGTSVSKLAGAATLATSTGVLTGTTGTSGNLTVSPHTDNKVYIENRAGYTLLLSAVLQGAA